MFHLLQDTNNNSPIHKPLSFCPPILNAYAQVVDILQAVSPPVSPLRVITLPPTPVPVAPPRVPLVPTNFCQTSATINGQPTVLVTPLGPVPTIDMTMVPQTTRPTAQPPVVPPVGPAAGHTSPTTITKIPPLPVSPTSLSTKVDATINPHNLLPTPNPIMGPLNPSAGPILGPQDRHSTKPTLSDHSCSLPLASTPMLIVSNLMSCLAKSRCSPQNRFVHTNFDPKTHRHTHLAQTVHHNSSIASKMFNPTTGKTETIESLLCSPDLQQWTKSLTNE